MGALPPARQGHLAAITNPKDFGELLRAIEFYNGSTVVRMALQLAPLVFVRTGHRDGAWVSVDGQYVTQ